MIVGFTGTRDGMTGPQRRTLTGMLAFVAMGGDRVAEFHHGSCRGSDVEAARLARELIAGVRLVAVALGRRLPCVRVRGSRTLEWARS
jgi:hypothetical protein